MLKVHSLVYHTVPLVVNQDRQVVVSPLELVRGTFAPEESSMSKTAELTTVQRALPKHAAFDSARVGR
jgi:hypothetical protein